MKNKIKTFLSSKSWKPYLSFQAIGLYVIAIVAISVTWSSVKVVQRNYRLQREVAILQQELDIVQLEVENQKLQNEYYASDAYLELAAKRQFNRANPGESMMIIPKEQALERVKDFAEDEQLETSEPPEEKGSNFQAWLDFLFGRTLSD